MLEQRNPRGTSSRRGLVRAGVWAVPAISMAAVAPVYAASRVGYFEFSPGSSYVSWNPDGFWTFTFDSAGIWVSGRDLGPNQLTMTVTFAPDPGSTDDQLTVLGGGPAGFSAQAGGIKPSASYTYGLSVMGGDAIWISDGIFFGTAGGTEQVGSFELAFTAPGFDLATYSMPVPQ